MSSWVCSYVTRNFVVSDYSHHLSVTQQFGFPATVRRRSVSFPITYTPKIPLLKLQKSQSSPKSLTHEGEEDSESVVQALKIPDEWLLPSRAIEESEWSRPSLWSCYGFSFSEVLYLVTVPGNDGKLALADTWALDTAQKPYVWQRLNPDGDRPSARMHATGSARSDGMFFCTLRWKRHLGSGIRSFSGFFFVCSGSSRLLSRIGIDK